MKKRVAKLQKKTNALAIKTNRTKYLVSDEVRTYNAMSNSKYGGFSVAYFNSIFRPLRCHIGLKSGPQINPNNIPLYYCKFPIIC